MGETTLEVAVVGFCEFFFGLISNLLSTIVWWWLVYVLMRFLLKNVVFKNDEDGLRRFSESVSSGFEELSKAFCSAMSGVASLAAQWADERREDRESRKSSATNDQMHHYW